MSENVIRVSKGVGSNPKLWAMTTGRRGTQVGEFDLGDEPGWYGYVTDDGRKVVEPEATATGINGMSGIVWRNGSHPADVLPRKLYASVDAWVADVMAEYPGYRLLDERDLPLKF